MSDPVNDDCTDLTKARQGHEAAYGRIYDRHAAVILSLCRRSGGSATGVDTDADDALQETFIRAFHKLDEVHDCRGFRAWLYRIARLVCSERRRAAGRRHRHEGAAMEQIAQSLTSSAAPTRGTISAGGALEHREQLGHLSAALDRLEDDERLAIHLYYLDSDPVSAAQAVLGLGRSGFYKLLARARESLAVQLREVVQP
ncbi:MAG: sigma-70 family RNA polymerase sigma factor [Phycisphaeraceae bacterium]|nr:sigma-70 family RNA polymerase sigma factor [Phycisphaeraceae bacterium]